jgi:ATP-dependent Clp protease ATP-binding subunit ClpX
MAKKKLIEGIEELQLPRPDEIKAYLDQYVIGQDEAKKTLSVAVYNHYKRIIYNHYNQGKKAATNIEKSNIILLGNSGGGKTYMVKKIAELLGVVTVVCDTTRYTASGYVGEDIENCLVTALRAANYNVEQTQLAIICLDEIDKIARKGAGPSITRDVSGESVQQGFLRLLESDVVACPPSGGRKHPEQQFIYVDTTNILFVGLGAFSGMEDIVKRRMGYNSIGFSNEKKISDNSDDYMSNVTPEDLREFGFIPEFIGRFPVITNINKLTEDDLYRILVEPKNSLTKQYSELLMMDGLRLKFEDEALKEIAHIANNLDTGARALRSVIESVMNDVMYEAPKIAAQGGKEINISKIMVTEKAVKYANIQKAA